MRLNLNRWTKDISMGHLGRYCLIKIYISTLLTFQEIKHECDNGISITFNRPVFTDFITPKYWLSEIDERIETLAIVGGNLRYIQPDTFMSPFANNIEHLILEDITLENLHPDSLLGLSALKNLDIRYSRIKYIIKNALRSVDETLEKLYVRSSGFWNPANLTGYSEPNHLIKVDFSSNHFGSVLGRESFRQLEKCELLSLASSKIIAIGTGTFDFMVSLRKLYLNNNYLVSLPETIFNRIIALDPVHKIVIDLQDNLWRCDCYIDHLRVLGVKGHLMLDPTCYTPYALYGRTFSSFDSLCCNSKTCWDDFHRNTNYSKYLHDHEKSVRISDSLYIDGTTSCGPKEISYLQQHRCITNRINSLEQDVLLNISRDAKHESALMLPAFYMESYSSSLLEIKTMIRSGYDFIWFQTKCLTEVYCTDILPAYLRIYNIYNDSIYVFCFVEPNVISLSANNCLAYSPLWPIPYPPNNPPELLYPFNFGMILLYVLSIVISITVGAACLYTVIRRKPSLLRGSKRILLVKHKAVEALVLPPSVPVRDRSHRYSARNTFMSNWNTLPSNNFTRRNSILSGKSAAPSYISALQPTEDQLCEWRLKQHFVNQPLSIESGLVDIYEGESIYFHDAISRNDVK